MTGLLFFIIVILLLSIAYMDLKERCVYLSLFIGLFATIFIYTLLQRGWIAVLYQLLFNAGIVLLITLFLLLFYLIKGKTTGEVINRKLGVGDIVFWISITPLFSAVNFLLFFIASLLVILLLVLCILFDNRDKEVKTIPLAGYQSVILALVLLVNQSMFHHDLSTDIFLLGRFLFQYKN
ncbi:MAG TPA: hypothetical protein PKE30_14840 [Niabella sp.]|nr:hypothetical protein [Niabella sp.]